MNKKIKFSISSNKAIAVLTLYMLLVFNVKFWQYILQHVPFHGSGNIIFWLTIPLFMAAAMMLCVQLLFWPVVHKVLVPVMLAAGAAAAYGTMTQNLFFNSDMMQNILQTDSGEAGAWITWRFFLWLTITGIIPGFFYVFAIRIVYTKPLYKEILNRLAAIWDVWQCLPLLL